MTALSTFLFLLAVCAATIIGRKSRESRPRTPVVTGVVCVLLLVCLLAQLAWPGLLPIMERDADAVRAGQVYRLATSLWFQDGWAKGGAFNLIMLGTVGPLAERLLSRPLWIAIYLGGGLLTGLVALSWQPSGAGNSIAYLSLAGALLGAGVRGPASLGVCVAGLVGLTAAGSLCLLRDIHGVAVVIGCALSLGCHIQAKRPATI